MRNLKYIISVNFASETCSKSSAGEADLVIADLLGENKEPKSGLQHL